MKGLVDSYGSDSRSGDELAPKPLGTDSTTSNPPVPMVNEHEKTVISQVPVAAPEEYYRNMPLADLAKLLEGQHLDHFAVEHIIGGGGMGAVFRGRDLRLDRTVAIKVIPGSKRDAETLRRFQLEAQSAARLDHPNIARVYYVGEAEQWNYIVFEFIDGINLRDLVDQEGPLTIDDAVFYTRQVAEALEHACERNVVHRDIKPSNVLVTSSGHVKLVDMGLARDTSEKATTDKTASGVTLGTFDYISPEQAKDPRVADVRSDLYSLGCTLFFILTGNPPFPEGTALQKLLNHSGEAPPDPRAWREDISDKLYDIMMKLMAKKPADRYQQPLDLINDLLLLAEGEGLERSRTPGTMLMTPTVAQRTLLEANLPWIVALAFLLGSTLWQQSVESLSTTFRIPDANFATGEKNSRAAANVGPQPVSETSSPITKVPSNIATSNEAPPQVHNDVAVMAESPLSTTRDPITDSVNNDVSPEIRMENRPSETPHGNGRATTNLVVCSTLPPDVERSAWVSSLSDAIRRAEVEEDVRTIEIAGRIIVDQRIELRRSGLTISSSLASSRSVIEFSNELVNSMEPQAALIEVGGNSLQMLDVSLVCDNSTKLTNHSLFGLSDSGSVRLSGCEVTVRGDAVAPKVNLISIRDKFSNHYSNSVRTNSNLSTEPFAPVNVSLKQCIVRGWASLVQAATTHRVEIEIDNCLLALAGHALEVQSVLESNRLPPVVRLYCNRSTIATAAGFALMRYQPDLPPGIALHRTSTKCVYWSLPGLSHIQVDAIDQIDGLSDLISLHGDENVYDDGIASLCQVKSNNDVEWNIRFSASQADWYREFGNEGSIGWLQPPPAVEEFSKTTPAQFGLDRKNRLFSPGFQGVNRFREPNNFDQSP